VDEALVRVVVDIVVTVTLGGVTVEIFVIVVDGRVVL
jgi:hypothetical protein